jgi:hypothetical protein
VSNILACSFEGGIAVTPSDTAIVGPFAALFVGTGGTVTITDAKGHKTQYALATSSYLYVQSSRVWATGTSASGIVGLFANPIGGP